MTKTTSAGDQADQQTEAETTKSEPDSSVEKSQGSAERRDSAKAEEEIGGPQGPEPTRYGDWEKKGRCIDF